MLTCLLYTSVDAQHERSISAGSALAALITEFIFAACYIADGFDIVIGCVFCGLYHYKSCLLYTSRCV